jgi:hypothetical protein
LIHWPGRIDRLIGAITNPNSELFAVEPANLFIEPVTELEEALDGYRALAIRDMDEDERAQLRSALQKMKDSAISASISPLHSGRDVIKVLQRYHDCLATVT